MYCRDCNYPLKGLKDPRCPECGRGFDPKNPKSFSRQIDTAKFKKWMFRARIVVLPLVLVWMLHMCWGVRCWDISQGLATDMLRISLVAVTFGGGPIVLLIWIGCSAKRYLLGVALSLAFPMLAAQALASYEEHWFVSECQSNPSRFHRTRPTECFHNRWWTNDDCFLVYDTATGQLYGGD